ncbi:MAG: bifunctional riboflavin kinase/FMN adenylyltransferase [Planctomycetota bacterium]
MAHPGPTAVTIGTFDGVHAGHAALVGRCRERAGPDGRIVALVFDPHPAAGLPGREPPGRLTTFERRRSLLLASGADEVHRLPPDKRLLALTPGAFLRLVCTDFAPAAVVEGDDFRFGRGRAGTPEGLRSLGAELGFTVDIVAPVEVELVDQSVVRASSTTVRWLLEQGRVTDAARVLGRPYRITGSVSRGDRLGRTIGFPTANIATELVLPTDGVYAALAHLPDGRAVPAAVNVGVRPTVNGLERRFEAHLLGLSTSVGGAWAAIEGVPEYGWPIGVDLIAWVRDQMRFPSIDALRAQLVRDCDRIPGLLASAGTLSETNLQGTTS